MSCFRSGLNSPALPRAQLLASMALVLLTSTPASPFTGSVWVRRYSSPNPLEAPGGRNALGHEQLAALARAWRGGSLAWIAPSLAVPSRDPALKLHCCLIWVSGNECCTASCYRQREKTHMHLHALWKYVRIGLAEKLKPKHDLLWDCYNLQGNSLWIRSA